MFGFSDETYIDIASGNGGNGAVSFRREKFVPKGGPDGGDGGNGGNVVFVVKNNIRTLSHLKLIRHFRAENGRPGSSSRCYGRAGKDVEIPIPPGTVLKDPDTGKVIQDMTGLDRLVFLKGGRGGQGNYHFKTSTRQAPRFAQPGEPGTEMRIGLELLVIADIGFVGFPNAGKSSLLNLLTNAEAKVGAYPFTTVIPQLGMFNYKGQEIVLADIPGLLEGASDGLGMGIKFLRHISRTRGLAYFIDLSSPNFLDAYKILKQELKSYSTELLDKKDIIIGTKLDEEGAPDNLIKLKKAYPDKKVVGITIYDDNSLTDVKNAFLFLVSGEAKTKDFSSTIDNDAVYSETNWMDEE